MKNDAYENLGVSNTASSEEIKIAYRNLVKKYHPDIGGSKEKILVINAAWEILKDKKKRDLYDLQRGNRKSEVAEARARANRSAYANCATKEYQGRAAAMEDAILKWLNEVYSPINRLLGQILKPFSSQIKMLSADPYDDDLMNVFSEYLEESQKKLDKVEKIFRSTKAPKSIDGFALTLYQCLSQVQDGFVELERYTMGYVDNYLHDGREMLREATKRRKELQEQRKQINTT